MKTKNIIPSMIACLLIVPALPVRATVDSILTVQLTCYQQGETSCVDDIFRGRVERIRVGTREILAILEQATGIDFPNGSRIWVGVDGGTCVVDRYGEMLADVAPYLRVPLDLSINLFDGTYNKVTEQERSTIYFPISMTLDVPDQYCEVFGLAIERFSASRPFNGRQMFNGSITATVTGGNTRVAFVDSEGDEGSFSFATFYQGRIMLRGREVRYQADDE